MSCYPGYRFHRAVRHGLAALALAFTLAGGTRVAALAASDQRTFASPDEATAALAEAVRADDSKALLGMFGHGAEPLISSGDKVADRAVRERFVAMYDEGHRLVKEGDTQAVLQIGKDEWPFPIPLVSEGGAWRFDVAAGQQEILNRRIGANELSAIQVCLAYVDAQRDYWQLNPDKSPLLHYARKVRSTEGKRDGLYWKTGPGEPESPLGPLAAQAQREGYSAKASGKRVPYHGYYYRILTAQGPDAPGGAYDYLVRGKMIGGFALIAYPAQWAVSGVMTFIVNHEGVVYQKNLGRDTAAIAATIKTYNPDSTWQKVPE